jgi:hypothetical protein
MKAFKSLTGRSLLLALPLMAAFPRLADACGGCFAPPDTFTSVNSHRMVIALSPQRTTLWDQIRYSGNPEDFVWVLPVPSSTASIEIADPIFFDEIEASTQPMIFPPPLEEPDCPAPPFEDEYFSSGAQDAGAFASDSGVTVFREETVGPYDTVTIGSDSATALQDWLVAHGYLVPDATLPTIEHFVKKKNVFVALRLSPGQGVQAMQPVRVRYQGYMATFPLKMVTVGASGVLELTLWVIAEQRFEAKNYATVTVPRDKLVWDWIPNQSNYVEMFDAAIDAAGGRAWVAETAQPLAWFGIWSAEKEIATQGIPSAYLTRLRTRMLVDHLDQDLELGIAADSSEISTAIQVVNSVNAPTLTCPDWDGDGYPDTYASRRPYTALISGCDVGHSARTSVLGGLVVLLLLSIPVLRRLRRTSHRS